MVEGFSSRPFAVFLRVHSRLLFAFIRGCYSLSSICHLSSGIREAPVICALASLQRLRLSIVRDAPVMNI